MTVPEPAKAPDEPSITLHSSWFGICSALIGAVILLALGVGLIVANGFTILGVVITLAAIGASLVVLLDMPIATRFEATAIERVTPLRRRRLELDQFDRFSRMRRAVRRPGGASSSGLVAMRGRRQTLLVDRMEGRVEYDDLRAILGPEQAERLLSGVVEPSLNRTPTWTLRRRRWRPDSAGRR